jgi:GDP-mannose 4,6 dehydratase
MRVLVTGGAGFIGSHLCDAFRARGDEVCAIDDLSHGHVGRLPEAVDLHKGSVLNASWLSTLLAEIRPELICHLAAQVDVRVSVAFPGMDAEVNVLGTVNLLEAARSIGARIIFSSTGGALYGPQAPIPSPESTPAAPSSPYGVAKLCAEQYISLYNRMFGTGKLTSDDYTSHLVSLGGVDWNTITSTAHERLPIPVRQIADWEIPGEQYFQVEDHGEMVRHKPVLEQSPAHPKGTLREDVALFARAESPFNRKRTVTICNGMYGRGTYGAVRALTDARFRDRNSNYLRSRFGDSETYCLLTRVPIVFGATLTPDWTNGEYTLFEWSR